MAGVGKELGERMCLQWFATRLLLPLFSCVCVMDAYLLPMSEQFGK